MSIEVGMIGKVHTVVSEANSAKTMKSGALDVFATPAMVALMEEAACSAIASQIAEGDGSVGIAISTTHEAASGFGAEIEAVATVTAVDGRKISFQIVAKEGEKVIGRATHERFLINNEKFMSKLK